MDGHPVTLDPYSVTLDPDDRCKPDATNEVQKAVFTKRDGLFRDCWEDREAIIRGDFAAICDDITMMKSMSWDFSTTGECHLYIAPESAYDFMFSMAYKTDSIYKEEANFWIFRLTESGLFNKWIEQELSNASKCLQSPSASNLSSGVSGLSLESFLGSFLFLIGGLVCASVAFLAEFCVVSFVNTQQ